MGGLTTRALSHSLCVSMNFALAKNFMNVMWNVMWRLWLPLAVTCYNSRMVLHALNSTNEMSSTATKRNLKLIMDFVSFRWTILQFIWITVMNKWTNFQTSRLNLQLKITLIWSRRMYFASCFVLKILAQGGQCINVSSVRIPSILRIYLNWGFGRLLEGRCVGI